ncbi:MAG: hypothetical protein ACP5PJ_06570, partial [Acidimicrobiales bacterium]
LFGPSHLNLPFAEPLFDRAGELGPTAEVRTTSVSGRLASLGVDDLVSLFGGETRTIVVLAGEVGRGAGRLARYAADRGHLVFADPRAMSGVDPMKRLIGFPDQILRNREVWRQLAPERWVCVGEDFASKVLGEFQAYTVKELGAQLIRVTSWLDFYDPRRLATRIIWADVDATEIPCHVPSDQVPDTEWAARWRRYDHAVDAALGTYFGAGAPLDEPSLARGLYRSLGADDTLMVASSMPIRDVEWFGGIHPSPPRVFANRGVNGIDGTLSTFTGIVHARDSHLAGLDALDVAYLGDLAFLYDFTALFELRARRGLIVVPDNNGGAIFSFLPQRATVDGAVFERIFGTPHDLDIPALCRGLGLEVAVVSTRSELEQEVSRARKDDRLHLALLASTRSGNVEVHDRLVSQAVAATERSDR